MLHKWNGDTCKKCGVVRTLVDRLFKNYIYIVGEGSEIKYSKKNPGCNKKKAPF